MNIKNNKGVVIGGNGKLTATNLAVGDQAQINIAAPQSATDVAALLKQFREELARNDAITGETRQALEELAGNAEKEVAKEKPNKTLGRITAEGLKEATSTVAEIAPTLLAIATQVAVWFAR
jgi:hypothetical protein